MVGFIPPAACVDGGEGNWEGCPGYRDVQENNPDPKYLRTPLSCISASRNGSKVKAGLSPSVAPP